MNIKTKNRPENNFQDDLYYQNILIANALYLAVNVKVTSSPSSSSESVRSPLPSTFK